MATLAALDADGDRRAVEIAAAGLALVAGRAQGAAVVQPTADHSVPSAVLAGFVAGRVVAMAVAAHRRTAVIAVEAARSLLAAGGADDEMLERQAPAADPTFRAACAQPAASTTAHATRCDNNCRAATGQRLDEPTWSSPYVRRSGLVEYAVEVQLVTSRPRPG